jgi:hypothetical protein
LEAKDRKRKEKDEKGDLSMKEGEVLLRKWYEEDENERR